MTTLNARYNANHLHYMTSSTHNGRILEEGNFRLVEVALRNGGLNIQIVSASLEEPPAYAMLSYAWSAEGPLVAISEDYSTVHIRANLAEALTVFLEKKPWTLIWIDHFCLKNYNDVTGDPLIIPRLFQKSQLSILWAGGAKPSRKAAFDLIMSLASARKEAFRDSESDSLDDKADGIVRQRYQESLLLLRLEDWKALNELLDEAFFSRVWVMQEVIATQNPVLWCGSLEIRWETFCYALEAYAAYSFPNLLRSPGVQMVLASESVRLQRLSGKPIFLSQILEATRGLEADRKETKVIAALSTYQSLTSRSTDLSFSPSIDLEDACRLAAKAVNHGDQGRMIGSNQGHDTTNQFKNDASVPFLALSLAQDNENRSKIRGIPSWVPDWTEPLLVYRLNSVSSTFNASNGQTSKGYRYQTYSLDRTLSYDELVCKVHLVDTLGKVASYMPPRLWYDKYNLNGANSFFFIEWFDWAEINGMTFSNASEDRLLLEYAETIQAKGCGLWHKMGISESSRLLVQARSWLKFFDDETQEETEDIRQFHAACLPAHGRRFGITSHGRFCLVPRKAAANDLICIPFGSRVPFVFRKKESYFENIGECYVHGIMHGEACTKGVIEELEIVIH
ncbi:hypothetical protein EG329_011305 [Mollisiaceae sp. DMI_Dod_QoI]|nr:hypothetical protein EG329_011305 [Helotiales sp. DMI_Dod_QoI]